MRRGANHHRPVLGWLLWVGFVVYGSLLPFDFHALPVAEALTRLQRAPMLQLGIESRADWIANGLLFVPVGYLSAALLMRRESGALLATLGVVFGLGFSGLLAAGIELAQTMFPPRTVSRNDLIAEFIGGAVGVVLFAMRGILGSVVVRAVGGGGGKRIVQTALVLYALLFPAVVLFPFDFVLSSGEWAERLAGPNVGWWIADHARAGGMVRLIGVLGLEAASTLPVGVFAALIWARSRRRNRAQPSAAPLLGLVLAMFTGAACELAQLAVYSSNVQGISGIVRALALVAGAWATQHLQSFSWVRFRLAVRRASVAIWIACIVTLLALQIRWAGPWLDVDRALRRLTQEINFLPLYYHYFTSETQALASLIAISMVFVPIAAVGWAWSSGSGAVVVLAVLISTVVEFLKVFTAATRPDPTNILIAAATVVLVGAALRRAEESGRRTSSA